MCSHKRVHLDESHFTTQHQHATLLFALKGLGDLHNSEYSLGKWRCDIAVAAVHVRRTILPEQQLDVACTAAGPALAAAAQQVPACISHEVLMC